MLDAFRSRLHKEFIFEYRTDPRPEDPFKWLLRRLDGHTFGIIDCDFYYYPCDDGISPPGPF